MGSITAPTAVGMPSSGSTLVAGMTMYSAKAPSRSTPMIRVLRQMWALPVRHCRQCPHTIRPSAVTSWPALSSPTPSPDRKSTRLNSSHLVISYAVFCLKKKKKKYEHDKIDRENNRIKTQDDMC